MGLALEVGILADLQDNDEEGFAYHAAAFERLNAFLVSQGLPKHAEPLECEVWSGEMLGYAGLHDLRRLAAYLDSRRPLPEPASRSGESRDSVLEAYYDLADGRAPSILKRLLGSARESRRAFDHLIMHGDSEGYYLPFDFPSVLYPPKDLEIPGGMVGAAPRLLAELDHVARALAIPDDLTADSEELWEAADSPDPDGDRWECYGRESFGCVVLREGCRRAIAAGAALVFC